MQGGSSSCTFVISTSLVHLTYRGNTSHFILAGISIPIWHWRNVDRQINEILTRYDLGGQEIHTAWLLRPYLEQTRIPDFHKLDWVTRRANVERSRNSYLLALQKTHQNKTYKQAKKNYRHTAAYAHLTSSERVSLVREIADCVSGWGFARLFAECVDKLHFDSSKTGRTIGEQAFEQIASRFEQYLKKTDPPNGPRNFGLLVHDNNPTVARKHTDLMRHFHDQGTLWTSIERIIETPLFVDSALTGMVQIADLCSYALRRYVENDETDLFQRIFTRADRVGATVVGVRHFTNNSCGCEICQGHRRPSGVTA
jgi:hypothetical protein